MAPPSSPPLGDTLRRAIAARVVAGLRSDPTHLDPLIAAGVLDPRFAGAEPAAASDPVGVMRDLGGALESAFAQDPSLVAALGLDPLDLLRRDAVGPSAAMAGAARRNGCAVVVDGSESLPAAAAARSRGGRLIRILGFTGLLWFEDPVGAVRAMLDLLDAGGGEARAGADRGEVNLTGNDLFGPPVAFACRAAGSAATGEVLVTPALRDPIGTLEGVEFGFVAPRAGDGDDPPAVWSVRRA